jgi:hypothetical protein
MKESGKAEEQTGESIDHERREAIKRLAKYTAPAMLAVLLTSGEPAPAVTLIKL